MTRYGVLGSLVRFWPLADLILACPCPLLRSLSAVKRTSENQAAMLLLTQSSHPPR